MSAGPWRAFEKAAELYGERDFLLTPADSRSRAALSYAQALRRVEEIHCRLVDAGYVRGHRVALALDNTTSFFLHFLALNRLGCSIVPVNAQMSAHELRFVLDHADLTPIFTLDAHASHLRSAMPEGLTCVAVEGTDAPFPAPGAPSAFDDEAALLYTSGTTGVPKGCILTNEYFAQVGRHYTSLGGYCTFRPGLERLITPLPVTHMNALACSLMAMLLTGGCLIQLDRFHPSTWWRTLRESRATCFHYLGVMPAMLLGAPPSTQDDVSQNVSFGFGAGVDPRHHAAFEQRFGVPLIEAWAMTETGGAAWITACDEPRHVGQRCFGRAPAGLDWRIVDESGAEVASGEPGELWVRRVGSDPRHGFFSGYYKDPQATEQAWAAGWFHTGDIVRVGPDGSFYFVDRLKNVIRRSGENIAAVEVESVLMQHPLVRACAVTAVADEIRGEEVFAFVIPHTPSDRDAAVAIQQHCLSMLAYYKAPGFIAFVDSLPETASQKLARGEVKRFAARSIGEAFDLRSAKKRTAQVHEQACRSA